MSRHDFVSAKLSALAQNPYWREADARLVLDLWQSSSLSLSAFAAEHGLSHNRLARWRRRLDAKAPGPRFHPVRVIDSPSVSVAADSSSSSIEVIVAGGRRVAIDRGFDPNLLAEVVRALEAIGC